MLQRWSGDNDRLNTQHQWTFALPFGLSHHLVDQKLQWKPVCLASMQYCETMKKSTYLATPLTDQLTTYWGLARLGLSGFRGCLSPGLARRIWVIWLNTPTEIAPWLNFLQEFGVRTSSSFAKRFLFITFANWQFYRVARATKAYQNKVTKIDFQPGYSRMRASTQSKLSWEWEKLNLRFASSASKTEKEKTDETEISLRRQWLRNGTHQQSNFLNFKCKKIFESQLFSEDR